MKYREYLPEFLREIEDFRGLEEGFGPETERFREKSAAAADECCAETAGEAGIERFERMLGLPAGDMDLEQRRGQVLGRLRDLPPYSAGWLYRKLRTLCGEDGFLLEEDAENLRLRIGVPGDTGRCGRAFRPTWSCTWGFCSGNRGARGSAPGCRPAKG